MLYNTRGANPLSRFVSEIPPRLILDGSVKMTERVPRPQTRSYADPVAPHYEYNRRTAQDYTRPPIEQRPAQPNALNIPGLSKGFSAQPSAPQRALHLYRKGDRVLHAVFGKGNVLELEGEGASQKVIVQFDNGSKKRFSVNVAPLRKIDN